MKHFPNAFRDTMLFDELWQCNARELVICGAMSNMCIDAATRHAVDFGLPSTVIHDACAARPLTFNGRTVPAADVHASFMAALTVYARVTTLEEWKRSLEASKLAA